MTTRIEAAHIRAKEAARSWRSVQPSTSGRAPGRRLALGDPQADLASILRVLDAHGLLVDEGTIDPDVQLISIGDHFDWWCPRDERARVAQSGLETLAWLASHPADQVVILLGNHDLARVGELSAFHDDASFQRAQALADGGHEEALFAEFPFVATAQVVERDLSAFRVEQRELVTHLLRQRRLRVAHAAAPDLLVCHAGLTRTDLAAAKIPEPHHDAFALARHLDAALAHAVDAWTDGPLEIPGLHELGRRPREEGRGVFYHRPIHPDHPKAARALAGHPRRRYDPRDLPAGLTQVIGHIGDAKCRELLGAWADAEPARTGCVRHLRIDADTVRYARGVPTGERPALIFIDGLLIRHDASAPYELFDLDARKPVSA